MVASDTIYLIGTHSRDAVLYLVPPSSREDVVHRLLRAVSTATQPMRVDTLRQLATYFAASDHPEKSRIDVPCRTVARGAPC